MANRVRGGRSSSLDSWAAELSRLDVQDMSQPERDTVADLCGVLEQISHVRAGELRIVASGATGSMKSTTLSLLLGKKDKSLTVGLGAVTGVATELRLVQSDDAALSRSEVHILTEEAVLGRVRKLLRLPPDSHRTLSELAGDRALGTDDGNRLRAFLTAEEKFGFGTRMDMEDFFRARGSLDIRGADAVLVQRVIRHVPVPAEVWDLSWAGSRTVVLIDLPGTGTGQRLANIVRDEQEAIAHISLSIVALGDGSVIETQPVGPEPDCVFVATKLDKVANPPFRNTVLTIEEAIARCLREWQHGDRQTRVAAVSGMWAFPDMESWREFDATNPEWQQGQAKRADWQKAAWDDEGPVHGQFRVAVEAALRGDGGVGRLRGLVAELSAGDRGRIDAAELTRLITRGRALTEHALAGARGPEEAERRLQRLQDELDSDQAPVDKLRQLARDVADKAVYSLPEWNTVRREFRTDGTRRGPDPEIAAMATTIDLAAVAASAMDGAASELTQFLKYWSARYLSQAADDVFHDGIGDPGQERAAAAAGQFALLGTRIVDRLASGAATGRGGLMFRQVARTRAELVPLLERMVIWRLEPMVAGVRSTVQDRFKKRADRAETYAEWGPVIRAVHRELGWLAAEIDGHGSQPGEGT